MVDTPTKVCIVLLGICLLEALYHIRSGWRVTKAYMEGVEDGAKGIDILADAKEKIDG